jgi:hypothetical protein
MPLVDLLGRCTTATLERFSKAGATLRTGEADERDVLLIPSREIPKGAKEGDEVEVFVYVGSEGRPTATTRRPLLELGQVAFLEVTACTKVGAFVDWGLAKELLVPFKEQTADLHVGERYAIGLYVDDTGRLAGTMRVAEMLASGGERVEWEQDEWVDGEAWRNDPDIGLFVIVEKAFVGLVPRSEPHTLRRGAQARFRVSNVLPDGKIELSLRGHAHEELEGDARRILEVLARRGAPRVGDKSTPEEIRAAFGLSKKAFKRAVGRLLREGTAHFDDAGFLKRTP